MNVLFVDGPRCNSLALRFIQHGCTVHSYNTDNEVPIAAISCHIHGKTLGEEGWQQHLIDTIDRYNIAQAIPLSDAAVEMMAVMKCKDNALYLPHIDKCLVASTLGAAHTCLNKKTFEIIMEEEFAPYYPSAIPGSEHLVVMKPVDGFGSRGIKEFSYSHMVQHRLTEMHGSTHVFQRKIYGTEYTVDAYFNRQGKMMDAVPRVRQRVAGGEVVDSVTEYNQTVMHFSHLMGESIRLQGPVCFQFIVTDTGHPYIIEINPRFGSGCILALEAGMDMIQYIIEEWFYEREVKQCQFTWQRNLRMKRYFKEVFFDENTVRC